MHTRNPPWEPSATLVLPAPTGCQSSSSSAENTPKTAPILVNPRPFPTLLEEQGRARRSQPRWVIRTQTRTPGSASSFPGFLSSHPSAPERDGPWPWLSSPGQDTEHRAAGRGSGKGFGRADDKWDLPWRWDCVPSLCYCLGLILNPGFPSELTGIVLGQIQRTLLTARSILLWTKAGSSPSSCPGAISPYGSAQNQMFS